MFQSYFSLLLFACVVLLASCQGGNNPLDPGSEELTVTTTIAGLVVGDNAHPIDGMTITAHGRTTTTNRDGFFVMRDVRVPKFRCFVVATKGDVFAARATVPQENGVTHVQLMPLVDNNFKTSIDASKGGFLDIRSTTLTFPANCFATASGTPYTGTVEIGMRLMPLNWRRSLIGDLRGVRSDGSVADLYYYNMFTLELKSASGEELRIGQGKKVSVRQGAPPDETEVFLWRLDETTNIWTEQVKLLKKPEGCMAEIAQTGVWLLAKPVRAGLIRGRVLDNNEPVPGVEVQVGQQEVFTNENGVYECRVPTGIRTIIRVNTGGYEQGQATARMVDPVAENQTLTVDIPLPIRPTYLTGTLLDCNGQPFNGIVQVKALDLAYLSFAYTVVKDGRFKVYVEDQADLLVNSVSYDMAAGPGRIIAPVPAGTTRDIGTLPTCDNTDYTDIGLKSYASSGAGPVLSFDGEYIAVGVNHAIWIYNRKTSELVHTITGITGTTSFSNDGTKLLINGWQAPSSEWSTHIYSTSTWEQTSLLPETKSAVFMPDGQTILAVEKATNDVVQYAVSGAELQRFHVTSSEIRLLASRGPNEFAILFANGDSTAVERWSMTNNTSAGRFTARWGSTKFSGDGSVLGVLADTELRLYNVQAGTLIRHSKGLTGFDFAISSDGRYYACNAAGALCSVYETATGTAYPLPSYADGVFQPLHFSGNGLWLAASSYNNTIRVWRLSL